MIRAGNGDLAEALGSLPHPDDALVFVANGAVSDGWAAVLDELTSA